MARQDDCDPLPRYLAAFQLRHAYRPLDFHRHRHDDPRPDNGMSMLIGLESATTPEGLPRPLAALRGLTERPLAGTVLDGRHGV